jgi:predicted ATPase
MRPGQPERRTHDYVRHGTTSLFAALDVAREPAVFLFEDLHWFDRASEAFRENIVDAAPGNRSLLLLNFRPEYHAGWMQRSYYYQLPLLPLRPESTAELLGDLLGSHSSLHRLRGLIQERRAATPSSSRRSSSR